MHFITQLFEGTWGVLYLDVTQNVVGWPAQPYLTHCATLSESAVYMYSIVCVWHAGLQMCVCMCDGHYGQ